MPRAFNLSFNLNLHRLVPGFELRRRGNSQLRQALAAALERASLHPGLDLVARSVHTVELMIEIGPDVLAPASCARGARVDGQPDFDVGEARIERLAELGQAGAALNRNVLSSAK